MCVMSVDIVDIWYASQKPHKCLTVKFNKKYIADNMCAGHAQSRIRFGIYVLRWVLYTRKHVHHTPESDDLRSSDGIN